MPPEFARPLKIEVTIPADQEALLEGLDTWYRLGLLSEEQIRHLCQTHLTCKLPTHSAPVPEPTAAQEPEPDFITEEELTPPPRGRSTQRSPATRQPPARRQPSPQRESTPQASGFLAQRVSALMEEISVIWLLLLGVFLLVVSSGVLAASQWQNLSPVGQYGILWGYTVAFGAATVWAGRNERLQLTAQMLASATLLIIPINFWMMDAIGLGQRFLGGVFAFIAAISLSCLMVILVQRLAPDTRTFRFTAINQIALSWLHWGWGVPGLPLIATYLGTVGTTALLAYQDRPSESRDSRDTPGPDPRTPAILTTAIATLVMLCRALFVAAVPFNRLGLAIGLSGWLLCWLARSNPGRQLWGRVGAGIMLLGWLVAVTVDPPWQAIAISGLGCWLLRDRVSRHHRLVDLAALLLIGLQAYWLTWWLFPDAVREAAFEAYRAIAGPGAFAYSLISVGFFPYLWFMLWVSRRYRRRSQPQLANLAELGALALGFLMTLAGLGNPLMRSLNLSLSLLTLSGVTVRRPQTPHFLVYLTHAIGLAAVASWMHWFFPALALETWALVWTGIALAEWGLVAWSYGHNATTSHANHSRLRTFATSAWYLGLFLAALTYILFLGAWLLEGSDRGWIWLVVPVGLTALAYRPRFPHTAVAGWFSAGGLLLAQFLTFGDATPRIWGLALATAVMICNTARISHVLAAGLTVGFGLVLATDGALLIWGDRIWVNGGFLMLLSSYVLVLWLLRDGLRRWHTPIPQLYVMAINTWAIALTGINFCFLTFSGVFDYGLGNSATNIWVGATTILAIALIYRLRQAPTDLGFCGLAWAVELLTLGSITRFHPVPEDWWIPLAIANLALGLLTQLAGDFWVRRSEQPYRSSWHLVPLVYGTIGLIVGHTAWDAANGLYTVATALVLIGVGRRKPGFKPLCWVGLFGISFGAYEGLLYQLSQASGGDAGDAVVMLAGLAVGLAIAQRVGIRLWCFFLQFPRSELHLAAGLHWALGILLSLACSMFPLSENGVWGWIAVMVGLSAYGVVEGRERPPWIYGGVVTGVLAIYGLLYQVIEDGDLLVTWAGAIAAIIAMGLYLPPWRTWGWSPQPWGTSALVLPGAMLGLTYWQANIPTILIVGACYGWLARLRLQLRLSYVSLLLADWAILRWFTDLDLGDPLWYATVLGASLLYVAQVDPALQTQSDREKRHWLRIVAVGLICLTAAYQSETSILTALLTLALSLGLVLAGLALRIRAFLFVGTVTFVYQVLRQLWLLVSVYSLLIWAIGIVMGIVLIWIAATFEARRAQVTALINYWVEALEAWD